MKQTGAVFYTTNKLSEPAALQASTDTGCLDAAARGSLVSSVGGFGPDAEASEPEETPEDEATDPEPGGILRAADTREIGSFRLWQGNNSCAVL